MTQATLAPRIGVQLDTLQNWPLGKGLPAATAIRQSGPNRDEAKGSFTTYHLPG